MKQAMVGCCVMFVLFVLVGCAPSKPKTPPKPTASTSTPAIASFSVEGSAGTVLKVAESAGSFTVTGASGALGSLKLDSGKLIQSDAKGAKVGSVKKDADAFVLVDAQGYKVAKLSPKDGGYRLKDPTGRFWLKVKPRDGGGFKVNNDAEATIAKGKITGNTVVLTMEQGGASYTVTGTTDGVIAVVLAKQLTPLQQAALIIAVGQLK